MLKHFLKLALIAGIGMTGAACQYDSYGAPRGAYQPAPAGYSNPYNSGYYARSFNSICLGSRHGATFATFWGAYGA